MGVRERRMCNQNTTLQINITASLPSSSLSTFAYLPERATHEHNNNNCNTKRM
jgi:hypothetical protein